MSRAASHSSSSPLTRLLIASMNAPMSPSPNPVGFEPVDAIESARSCKPLMKSWLEPLIAFVKFCQGACSAVYGWSPNELEPAYADALSWSQLWCGLFVKSATVAPPTTGVVVLGALPSAGKFGSRPLYVVPR